MQIFIQDISDSRRRTRLFKMLKRFGSPVQESVFEFHLDAGELLRLKRAVNSILDHQSDQVRFYQLCPTCHQRTEMTEPSRRTENPAVIIV